MYVHFVFFSIILHWLLATKHHTFSLWKSAYCCTMIYAKDMSSSNGYCSYDVRSNFEAEEETSAAAAATTKAPQLLMMEKKMSTRIECGCQRTCFGRLISTINFLITQSCSIIIIYRWCWHASSMAQLAGFIHNLCFHTCMGCYWVCARCGFVGWFVSPRNLCESRAIYCVHPYFTRVNSKRKSGKMYCMRYVFSSDFSKC